MNDVRTQTAYQADELEQAENIPPRTDPAADVAKRHVRGPSRSYPLGQRAGAVRRDDDVIPSDEPRSERRDVRLRAALLGERDEKKDPRDRGHLDGRERYSVVTGWQAA